MKNFNARGGKLWCNECSAEKKKEELQHEEQSALNDAEDKGYTRDVCSAPELSVEKNISIRRGPNKIDTI